MTDIGFYHLTRTKLAQALPKLLEKVLDGGHRAVVRAGSEERVENLNSILWTYDAASFLPHGSARDGGGEYQPVWLTIGGDNPADAKILVLTDGVGAGDMAGFARCLEMFDGNDEQAVSAARARWSEYKGAGHTLTYWRQNDNGGWEKNDQG